MVNSTDNEASHYAVFSTPLLPRPSSARIFLLTLFWNTVRGTGIL